MKADLKKLLAEKLKDVSYDGKPVTDLIFGYYDGFEAKNKVQQANEEITKERELLKASVKEIKNNLEKKESELKLLSENQITDEIKKKLESIQEDGMTEESKLKHNQVLDQFNSIQTEMDEIKKQLEAEREEKIALKLQGKQKELETKISKALANSEKGKVEGNNIDIALTYLMAKGFAKIDKDENGNFKEIISIEKDGQMQASNIQEMVDNFVENNKTYAPPTINQNQPQYRSSGQGNHPQPQNLTQFRESARKNL